jgi:sialate O-acetylesterase
VRRIFFWTMVVCAALICWATQVVADVKLPAVIGPNMVLQRGRPVAIWGWADPNETVTVSIAGESASARADDTGNWQVTLPRLDADGRTHTLVVKGSSGSTVSVENVLVGEVWLCTGPSNIFWPVRRCDNAKEEIAAADFPRIRFFSVAKKLADRPQADCQGDWFECRPDTVGDVSGVGYFFARRVHRDLDVPIGVLQSFWGGSRVEAWTGIESLQAEPALKPILDWWRRSREDFDSGRTKADYQKQLEAWQEAVERAKASSAKPPAKPKPPENPHTSRHRPACLFNGMIAPLTPYAIRGAITYQGLGNLFWARYSNALMPTMVADWRSRWGQGDFPLGMVQPAPFPCDRWPKQEPDAYSLQRESQLLLLDSVPNTGVALTMDIDDLDELHFTNKQIVGRRMADWALASVYGRRIPYRGPVYKSMSVEGDKIRIRFFNTGTGLVTNDGGPPSHFTIAGSDKLFHPGTATIDVHTVVVHGPDVRRPVAVRFAWSETAVPNLFNKDGLPASLFRTDIPR